ncbi:Dehydrocurvularin biosynthesis regulator [Lasiodiplodia hormozganensis]|uniref:Dehydrocurvularin biosynthesis regulator n=1 Tax=Lasiodiplodia hormozganensis TaxID=869390 RepID=A0AA40D180_9PEZI|nr:Dehydrocurvularin biosynthesis regulator [Lasiodiplodia hormozganensis]
MTRSSSEAGVRDGGIRKKMRKGTHSCFECRRRKIRCIFSDEHPGECTECFARGSRCIDQEHADPEAIVDNRKNLRERVAKLEALIESLLDDRSATGAAETLRRLGADVLPRTPHSDASAGQSKAPLMAVFDNGVPTAAPAPARKPDPPVPVAPTAQVYDFGSMQLSCECDDIGIPKVKKSKEKRTRDTLLTLLPPKDVVEEAVTTNDDWWRVWRHKLGGTARGRTLQQFATQTLDKGSPAEVGVLLLCVGVALDLENLNNSLALVDALIISDDEYAATVEGMECAILVSKCYSEIGQPRRAWLAARKGLTYAQLMGLHRSHATNETWDSVWWSLYQTDRFLSLLLGLPYGISDAHCDMNYFGKDKDTDGQRDFMLKLSVLAGKVIDRTQGVHELSLGAALELDQELDTLVDSMPAGWWDTQSQLLHAIDPVQIVTLRERLLAQICFQQLRVYLHLPFMLRSASVPNSAKFEYSRSTCYNASRELLTLYHFLRGGNGEPLYECKVIDFLGFTAAVLIMLGLLGYSRLHNANSAATHPSQNVLTEEQDWRLMEMTMDIFGRASNEKGGKVAAQSLKVLQQLSSVRNRDVAGEETDCTQRIVIPYFGAITIRRGKNLSHALAKKSNAVTRANETSNVSLAAAAPGVAASAHSMSPPTTVQQHAYLPSPSTSQNQHSNASSVNGDPNGLNNPYIAYDPFLFPGAVDPQSWAPGEDGLDSLMSGSHGGPWQNLVSNMDIDQDWAWYMGGQMAGSQAMPPA